MRFTQNYSVNISLCDARVFTCNFLAALALALVICTKILVDMTADETH